MNAVHQSQIEAVRREVMDYMHYNGPHYKELDYAQWREVYLLGNGFGTIDQETAARNSWDWSHVRDSDDFGMQRMHDKLQEYKGKVLESQLERRHGSRVYAPLNTPEPAQSYMPPVRVHLLSYTDYCVREVYVPTSEWCEADFDGKLQLVFKYGHNEFQPQHCRSVSVGDVVELNGELYLVAFSNFHHVSVSEFARLCMMDPSDRPFCDLAQGRATQTPAWDISDERN